MESPPKKAPPAPIGGSDAVPHVEPRLVELLELVRAQRDFVARFLRGETDTKRDLALQQRLLDVVSALASEKSPVARRDPRGPYYQALGAANLFDIAVRQSHRGDAVGRLVTSLKRGFVRGLKPFHIEVLRPQSLFNHQLLRFADQVLDSTRLVDARVLSDLADQTLRAVAAPDAWAVRSHRRSSIAKGIESVKRSYLAAVRPLLSTWLARQHAWNQTAIQALQLVLSREHVSLAHVHVVLGQLGELGRLPVPDELPAAARATYPLWIELLRRQEAFNVWATEMFAVLFDVPRPADDGRLAAYPTSVLVQEHERMADVARQVSALVHKPLISIVVPTYETAEAVIRGCIDSVLAQSYDRWELCLVDDGSKSALLKQVLEEYARRDPRIRVKLCFTNRGIALATNEALGLAHGDYVAFLDHDDELAPHALGEVALYLAENPATDFLYTDEDRLDLRGQRQLPFFKPDWSPDLLRACNYVCHFLVARRQLVEDVGRVRPGFDGAQDYDLVLRMSEKARHIGHVPRILYHWRATPQSTANDVMVKPQANIAGVRALQEHLERCGERGQIETPIPTNYRVRYELAAQPKLSLIIAAETSSGLERLLKSVAARTAYEPLEIIVCHPGDVQVSSSRPVVEVAIPGGARLGQAYQLGAMAASGDVLIFLQDTVEATDPTWVVELAGHALRPGVGAVGPKLVYPDGTIAHAGLVVGGVSEPTSPFAHMADHGEWTTMGNVNWTRNYLAVGGACIAVRRSVWDAVGGFDVTLAPTAAAVDFCLRVRERGWRVVFTPHTKLRQWSAATEASSGARTPPAVAADPFYNPNLSTRVTNGRVRAVTAFDG